VNYDKTKVTHQLRLTNHCKTDKYSTQTHTHMMIKSKKYNAVDTAVKVAQLVDNFWPIFRILRRQFLRLLQSFDSQCSDVLLKHVISHWLNGSLQHSRSNYVLPLCLTVTLILKQTNLWQLFWLMMDKLTTLDCKSQKLKWLMLSLPCEFDRLKSVSSA